MGMIIILVSIAIVILIAVIFFGVMGNGARDNGYVELTNLQGVEKHYKKCIDAGCAYVLYIGVLHKDADIKVSYTQVSAETESVEKYIMQFCAVYDAKAAKVDGKNYVFAVRTDRDTIEKMCRELLNRSAKYMEISIGIYIADSDEQSFKKAAGYAKKIARRAVSSKDRCLTYDKESIGNVLETDEIEKNIEASIDKDEFYLLFQPFVDAKSGGIVGCEALARLRSKGKNEVLPRGFLHAIKNEKLNAKFDLYVYRKCCEWTKKRENSGLIVTCNFSRQTLSEKNFSEKISEIDRELGTDPGAVAIEVIEDYVVTESVNLMENIARLRENGHKICLDDFGKAYTSIGDILEFSPDVIKIDKSMLYSSEETKGKTVFDSIVRLAKEMHFTVLCEGVETEEQMNIAKSAGCDVLQGFYFFKPLKESQFDNVLKNDEKFVK